MKADITCPIGLILRILQVREPTKPRYLLRSNFHPNRPNQRSTRVVSANPKHPEKRPSDWLLQSPGPGINSRTYKLTPSPQPS